jgi:hypothetical protein
MYLAEWKKLKRPILFWILLIFLSIPLMYLINFIGYPFGFHRFVDFIPFALTAYIFSREYREKTISQLLCYPQSPITIFFGKMYMILSVFTIYFLINFLYLHFLFVPSQIYVRDVHLTIMTLILIPFIALLGMMIRNSYMSMVAQIGLGWLIYGHMEKIENRWIYISPFRDINVHHIFDPNVAKTKIILMQYFFGNGLSIAYTLTFITLSILSVFLISFFSKRHVVTG